MMTEAQIENRIEEAAAHGNADWALAYATLRLAKAQERTARAIILLGNADAATPMGAIEALGKHIGEAIDRIADAVDSLADK